MKEEAGLHLPSVSGSFTLKSLEAEIQIYNSEEILSLALEDGR